MTVHRLAIVGGGAAAATLLCELLDRRPAHPLHIDWHAGAGALACGIAYGAATPRHLLNVRAASMGLYARAAHGFLDFVQRDEPQRTGNDFLPRQRYGEYLQVEVARAQEEAAALGHRVDVLPGMVDALRPGPGGIEVIHGLRSRHADAVVLAVGALPPRPLAAVPADVMASGRYVVDPWPLLAQAPGRAPAPRAVTVLGTGLTAVDVVLELAAQWPHAEFTAVSPHGRWPEAHRRVAAGPAGAGNGLFEAMREHPDVHRWLRLVRETMGQGGDWRAVIDALRPHAQELWLALSAQQHARFLRHVRSPWQRARHRMAPDVAAALAGLERSGRLRHRPGRVLAVGSDGDASLHLTLADPHAAAPVAVTADLVVQAIGLDTDIRRTPHHLLRQLLADAHVEPDALGLGLRAQPDGRILHHGTAWPNFFALGALLRGTLWECTALPEIRQQARRIADQLLDG